MFDHLLESSRRDDSNTWLTIEFGKEIGIQTFKISILFDALYCNNKLVIDLKIKHD